MTIGDIRIKTGSSYSGSVIIKYLGGLQVSGGDQDILISGMFDIRRIAKSTELASALTGGTGDNDLWVVDSTQSILTPDIITTQEELEMLGVGPIKIRVDESNVIGGNTSSLLINGLDGSVKDDQRLRFGTEDLLMGDALYVGGGIGPLVSGNFIGTGKYFALGNTGSLAPILFSGVHPDPNIGEVIGLGYSDMNDYTALISIEEGAERIRIASEGTLNIASREYVGIESEIGIGIKSEQGNINIESELGHIFIKSGAELSMKTGYGDIDITHNEIRLAHYGTQTSGSITHLVLDSRHSGHTELSHSFYGRLRFDVNGAVLRRDNTYIQLHYGGGLHMETSGGALTTVNTKSMVISPNSSTDSRSVLLNVTGSGGIAFPFGGVQERPIDGLHNLTPGTVRINTDTNRIEYFTLDDWHQVPRTDEVDKYNTVYNGSFALQENVTITITVDKFLGYIPNQSVLISHSLDHYMIGIINEYNENTGELTVYLKKKEGSGSFNTWQISSVGISIASTLNVEDTTNGAEVIGQLKTDSIIGKSVNDTIAGPAFTIDMDNLASNYNLILNADTSFDFANMISVDETAVVSLMLVGGTNISFPDWLMPLPNNDVYNGGGYNQVVISIHKGGTNPIGTYSITTIPIP